MQRTLQIVLEIVKRPHLWNVESPDPVLIAETLLKEKVYKSEHTLRDRVYAVNNYLKVILEIKRILECQS